MAKEPTSRDQDAAEELLGGVPLSPELEGAHAYCVQCKKKVLIHMPRIIRMRNGKPAITGDCNECSAKVFKLGLGK